MLVLCLGCLSLVIGRNRSSFSCIQGKALIHRREMKTALRKVVIRGLRWPIPRGLVLAELLRSVDVPLPVPKSGALRLLRLGVWLGGIRDVPNVCWVAWN